MDIYKERRKLAKRANERMRRLEKSVSDITGKNFTYGAYDIAEQYLATPGKPRFSEGMLKGKSEREILNEIRVLEKFLFDSVSTVSGMRKIEDKRVKAFEKNGISAETARDSKFYSFLNSSSYDVLLKSFTSKQVQEAFDKGRKQGKTPEEIEEAFKNFSETDKALNGEASWKDLQKAINAVEIPNSINL